MRTNGPATGRAHHLIDIGAGEADIGQHAVIEGDQAGEGATLFRTPEKGGEKGHFIIQKWERTSGWPFVGGLMPRKK